MVRNEKVASKDDKKNTEGMEIVWKWLMGTILNEGSWGIGFPKLEVSEL